MGGKGKSFSGGKVPRGKGSQTGKGGTDFREEKGEDLGGKGLRVETGERILTGKGGKDLGEEKGDDLRRP